MKNLKIVKGANYYPYTNGVHGTFVVRGTNYSFSAKIYNEPSHWGINCGRVSKLWVTNKKLDKLVFEYDRILCIGTEKQIEKGMVHDLIVFFENNAVEEAGNFV